MRGRFDAEKRRHHAALVEARWAGLFAQAAPKEHERLLKALLAEKKPLRPMAGKEIGMAMRAWAQRMGG